jgi:hypothetical protein
VAPVSESTSRDVRAKVIRRILVTTVGIEAAVVGGYGVVLAVDTVTQKVADPSAGAVLALIAGVICLGLAVIARVAARGARAVRAPIIVWQILQAALAKDALTAESAWGVVLLLLVATAVVGACWPGVLHDGSSPDDPPAPD